MAKPMPVAAAFFSLFVLGSLGLPGLSGFVGEFLILVGAFQYVKVFAVLASIGIILGAAYLLWMYQRTMFQQANEKWLSLKDLAPGRSSPWCRWWAWRSGSASTRIPSSI